MVDPGAFAPADIVGSYGRGLQVAQAQEERQNRRRLGDLLPQAAKGDQAAIEQIAHIDPRLFMQLDERQKRQAAAELDDVSAAVRWADTPEKWAQVQQYYGSHGHDVSGYTFENREAYLLSLGKMGEYLKGAQSPDQPSSVREYEYAKGHGFSGSFMDYQNQTGSPIVQRNDDGTITVIPRSMIGGAASGGDNLPSVSTPEEARQLPPGTRFRMPDGRIGTVPGGPSQNGSGGFPQ